MKRKMRLLSITIRPIKRFPKDHLKTSLLGDSALAMVMNDLRESRRISLIIRAIKTLAITTGWIILR